MNPRFTEVTFRGVILQVAFPLKPQIVFSSVVVNTTRPYAFFYSLNKYQFHNQQSLKHPYSYIYIYCSLKEINKFPKNSMFLRQVSTCFTPKKPCGRGSIMSRNFQGTGAGRRVITECRVASSNIWDDTMWGPQTIAKLVNITSITRVYDTYNYS